MNEIFNLHLDPSGLTGGPMSSRHMNRDQARQVFRDSLINKYTLFRAVDEDSCENFNYIARAEEKLGIKFLLIFRLTGILRNLWALTEHSTGFENFNVVR